MKERVVIEFRVKDRRKEEQLIYDSYSDILLLPQHSTQQPH
jgi:hypothetical protein